MPRNVTPRTAGPPPRTAPSSSKQGPPKSHEQGPPDVIAEELTGKLSALEDKLRKELLGLGNEAPQHSLSLIHI